MGLRDRIADIDHWKNDPFEVVRFMLEHEKQQRKQQLCCYYDLDGAEKMFRNMIEWRIENNVDTILSDYVPPQELLDHSPAGILRGTDRDGDPIYVERTGALDATGLLKKYGKETLVKQVIWMREQEEWLKDYNDKEYVKTMTIIIDLKGLNLQQHCNPDVLKVYNEIVELDSMYYPGFDERIVLIRAPGIFHFVWNIVKNFIDDFMFVTFFYFLILCEFLCFLLEEIKPLLLPLVSLRPL